MKKLFLIMLSLGLFLTACKQSQKDESNEKSVNELTGSVTIDGSGTVFPLSEAVAEEYLRVSPNVKVTVGESGTGGGFKKFGSGTIDIAGASRDIKDKEIELCKENNIEYLKLTVALDGIAVVVNKENTWATSLTVAELKKIWEPNSTVKKWSDIRKDFPKEDIRLYGPNTSHGTYDFFTETIMGESGASRTDFNAVSDYNVAVQGIEKDKYALGYFGLSYYEENKNSLGIVGIDNGNGVIIPTLETVASNQYAPLSRSLFIFVNKQAAQRPEVQNFIEFYLDNAPVLSKDVGYVPMPSSDYDTQKAAFKSILQTK